MRGMDAPFIQIVAIGQLHERCGLTVFQKDLGAAGAVRDEHEPLHPVVIGREVVEGMVVDRTMRRHLPHGVSGCGVGEDDRLGLRYASLHSFPPAAPAAFSLCCRQVLPAARRRRAPGCAGPSRSGRGGASDAPGSSVGFTSIVTAEPSNSPVIRRVSCRTASCPICRR